MNNNIFLRAFAISLVLNNSKFSYSQTGEMYSKNEFALESLQYALRLGIIPFKVCFDSKYSSSKLLNWLDNNNLRYYSQLASNRSFNGQQLKMHRFQPYAH